MGAHTYQTSFAGGELSPKMYSRPDYRKFLNGAGELINLVVLTTGGAARRAGSQFITRSKSRTAFQPSAFQDSAFQMASAATLRLVPFVFNTQEAYNLEFGNSYIRFFRNRAPIVGSQVVGAAELLANGTFDTDLTGWTLQQDNGATVTQSGGVALLTVNAGTAGISQAEGSLVAGTFYVVEFTVQGGGITIDVGTSLGTGDLVGATTVGVGTHRAVFKATGTTAFVNFRSSVLNAVVRLDNVSMKEADVLELTTLYTTAELRRLRFTQSADTLYICHRNHPVRKLIRQSDLVWTLQDVVFSPPPTQEVAITPAATLTPGATTGQGVAFNADASVFLNADVNRQILSGGGVGTIVAVVSGTQVTVDITAPFLNTNPIGAGSWRMDGSPFSTLTLGATGPVNAIVSLTLGTAGFRATDVGSFVLGLNGIFEIVTVTSSTAATAKCLKVATGTSLGAGAWTLEQEAWSTLLGFPETVVFEDQRLWFAKDQTFWGSQSGDFENFGRGTNDNDSPVFTIASNTVDLIRWMKNSDRFLIGTIGNEWAVDGGNDQSITPSRIHVKSAGAYGSDPEPDALRVGDVVIYVQRGRKQIRELAFSLEKFAAAEISILAEHLLSKGIIELAHVSAPGSWVLSLLDDGRIALCTYERPEEVVAWSQLRPAGWETKVAKYIAMSVIPSKCGSGDEAWVAVDRLLANGRHETFIEVLDGQLNTDGALVYEGPPSITTLTGLNHWEAEVVDVVWTPPAFVQAGVFQKSAFQRVRPKHFTTTVTGNTVALPSSAERVEVGKFYPSKLKTLPAEAQTQNGTAMFRSKRTNTLSVRFFCTHGDGVKVQDELVPSTKFENEEETTDWQKQANLGWDRRGRVVIEQTKPFPMTVLGIAYSWTVDDGDKP